MASAADVSAATEATIVVDFDGPSLNAGERDDATTGTTAITELAMQVQPYDGTAVQRQAIIDAVATDFAPFNIRVVDRPPASGEYMLAVVTPTNPFGDDVSGVAVTDCDDAAGRRDIVFAFFDAQAGTAVDVASTISQEIGHAFGLEHVDDAADILFPFATGADPYFNDECLPLPGEAICAQQHRVFCEQANTQNSYAELLAAVGPGGDDAEPPTVSLREPEHSDSLRSGDDLVLTVDASDDYGIDRITLYEGGDAIGQDQAPPYTFVVTELVEGDYEVYAVAVDAAGNEAMSEVVEITVARGGVDGPAVWPSSVPRGGPDAGCGCRSGGRQGSPIPWLVVAGLLGLATRRPPRALTDRCDSR